MDAAQAEVMLHEGSGHRPTALGGAVCRLSDIMPRYGTARTMIEDGVIGPVRQIITERMSSRVPRDDNGVIAALGIHDFDICCDLLGDVEPEAITGMASPSVVDGIEDHAALQMRFPPLDGEPGAVAYITSPGAVESVGKFGTSTSSVGTVASASTTSTMAVCGCTATW